MPEYQAIGFISSPFKQKFAIPRQPNLVPEAIGELLLQGSYGDPDILRELESFSHLWLLFHFHATADQGWTTTVQPPRLGGREKVGVLASRSPFRPNPIGMSVVKNLGYEKTDEGLLLRLGGIDLLDGTPVLDIKPYVPYADSIEEASGGFAASRPGQAITIEFSAAATAALETFQQQYPQLQSLITSLLQQDPRPAWRVREQDDKQYGMSLYTLNIKWRVEADRVVVLQIEEPGNL